MTSSIKAVSSMADQLIQLCEQTTFQAQTTSKVDESAQRHGELKKQLDMFHHDYDELWKSTSSRDDTACEKLTQILDRVDKSWQIFEDNLLTAYPQAEINYGRPLLGSVIPSDDLPIDPEIKIRFPYYQQVRGDGNCFYSSFSTVYLQWLCKHPDQFENVIQRVLDLPAFPGQEETIQLLMDLKENTISLESCLQSNQRLFEFISFLRHCAAHQMTEIDREWMESYLPESEQDQQTADQFVTNHVLKMGCDAQDYEISAITKYLGCQIFIVDNLNGLRKINETSESLIGALYRAPGHYSCMLQSVKDDGNHNRIAEKIVKYIIPLIAIASSFIYSYYK